MNTFESQPIPNFNLSEQAQNTLMLALASKDQDVTMYRSALVTAMLHDARMPDIRQFADVFIIDKHKRALFEAACALLEEEMSNPDLPNALTESAPSTLTLADPIFRRYRETNPEEYYRLLDELYVMYQTGGAQTLISELEQGRLHKIALNQLLDLAHSNPEEYNIDKSDSELLKSFISGSTAPEEDIFDDELAAFVDGTTIKPVESGNNEMTRAA